jgi:hypothetical protein
MLAIFAIQLEGLKAGWRFDLSHVDVRARHTCRHPCRISARLQATVRNNWTRPRNKFANPGQILKTMPSGTGFVVKIINAADFAASSAAADLAPGYWPV